MQTLSTSLVPISISVSSQRKISFFIFNEALLKSIAHIPSRVLTVNLITPWSVHVKILHKRFKDTTIWDSQTEWNQTSLTRWTTAARPSPGSFRELQVSPWQLCYFKVSGCRSAPDRSWWGTAILKKMF